MFSRRLTVVICISHVTQGSDQSPVNDSEVKKKEGGDGNK